MNITISEVGDPSISCHETAGLADIGHGSVKGEGEVSLDAWVVVQVRNGLVSKGHSIAVASVKVSASKLGEPERIAREVVGKALNVVVEVIIVGTIPMEREGIGLSSEASVEPLVHPLNTRGGGGGGGGDDGVTPVLEGDHVGVPHANTISSTHLRLVLLVDFVHGQGNTIVGTAIDDLRLEVADRLGTPEHGHKLEAAGEGRIGGPSGPVVVPASLASDSIENVVGGHRGTPGETDLASRASGGRVGRISDGSGVTAVVVVVVATAVIIVVAAIGSSRGWGSVAARVGRGARGDGSWLLGDAAFPVLVGATLALQDSVMVWRVSVTSSKTMTVSSDESVCWSGRVEEDAKGDGGGGDEDVEDGHCSNGFTF
jgi:hypothetical protein